MPSPLSRHLADARAQAAAVLDELNALLAHVEVDLPSVGVDWASGQRTGVFLIDLGAARPHVIAKLVAVLRDGVKYRVQQLG
jgi:hypothetical protein